MSKIIPYLQRLDDGRNVWLNGEIVEKFEQHPAFKGTVHSVNTLLESQTKVATKSLLTYKTEEGLDANLSFLVPKTHEDLERKRLAYKYWADQTFGVMSRLSEYSRSLFTGWFADRKQLEVSNPGFTNKIEDYYYQSRNLDLLSTAVGHDPQKNRSKSIEEKDPGILHITRKNSEGVFVRGAKMIATAAPYVDELLIFSYHKRGENEREFANVFLVPVNAKGLHLVCRESFADERIEDHPLSSRFDEMDAVLIFDDVFIPWERVIVHEDPELAWKLRINPASSLLSQHQTVVRLISKLEGVVAIGNEIAETAGATQFLHVKEKLAELIIQLETIKALLVASEQKAKLYNGILLPNQDSLTTARNLGTRYYPRALEILQQIGAGGLLQVPSRIEDLDGELGSLLQQYFKGTDTSAKERTQLIKLAWDIIGSPLAARHELYERFYSGDPVRTFAAQSNAYQNKQQLIDYAYEAIK
ncbi:MAG: 4-hydroxyphenylacetate 3-hydroxylase [Bacillus sp. (in: firmicutes)]|jgi:4-hydroxyphenylacetate 3-monooxygenase|nr:4-hydroxyphenylacetate 3-hydroxylase [Bacillus sp. (in: firmicutes)]